MPGGSGIPGSNVPIALLREDDTITLDDIKAEITSITSLPPEILGKILSKADILESAMEKMFVEGNHQQMLNCALVCSSWTELLLKIL